MTLPIFSLVSSQVNEDVLLKISISHVMFPAEGGSYPCSSDIKNYRLPRSLRTGP